MPREISRPLSGVRVVALRKKTAPLGVIHHTADSPAARIREAEELIRALLLENEFEEDRTLLGAVSDGLEQVNLVLSTLAGRQELFELVMAQ